MLAISIISPLASILVVIIVIIYFSRKLKEVNVSERRRQNNLYDIIDTVSRDKELYQSRTKELEDAREEGYGVKARIEKIEVKTEFTKFEWTVILAGVSGLLKAEGGIEDLKIYIAIIEKISNFINHMEG